MVRALNVANTVLNVAFKEKIDITPMKLQKLIYFIYKRYLQEVGVSLFPDPFQAWQYGPVVLSVYDEFKKYGANHIKKYYKERNGDIMYVPLSRNDDFKDAFDYVWENYSRLDGIYLSSLTHKIGTAWYKTLEKEETHLSNKDIKNEEWFK